MKKFKKYYQQVVEIALFIFALAIFCYSGYKIANHYGLLNGNIFGKKVSGAESCFDWSQHPCSCRPTVTPPPPGPTPTTTEPSPTSIPEPTSTPQPTPTGEPVVTPTPTSSPGGVGGTSDGGGGGGGGGGGPASPCTPPEAPKSPELLSAVRLSSTEVKLTWKKVDRATHYVIAYGLSSQAYTYGNPDVGNVDSYVVGNLGAGRIYYFVVSAAIGGDCPVASPYSNDLASGKTGVLGAKTVFLDPEMATGGEALASDQLGGGICAQAGEVAGAAKCLCPFWGIVLLGQTVVLGIFYALNWRRKEWLKGWWLVTAAAVSLAYYIDRYAHTHWYAPSSMCRWEIWLGILLAILETRFFKGFKKLS